MPAPRSRVRTSRRSRASRWCAPSTASTPSAARDLRRYFRDCTWAIHVPRGEQERALAVEKTNERLMNVQGRPPTVQEIAEYMELSTQEVLEGLQAAQSYSTLSLDAPSGSPDDEDDCT